MLPSWLDVDAVRIITAGAIAVFAFGALVALVRVNKAGKRVTLVVVCAGLAGATFLYRNSLDECERTCSCRILDERIDADGCFVVDEAGQGL